MADDNKNKIGSGINKLVAAIRDNTSKFYTGTYFSQPTNAKDLANIKKSILSSINSINSNNMDNVGMANISKLYSRMQDLNKDGDFKKKIEDVFSDKANMDDIMQTYIENKYLKDLDKEIDIICKYMPKLLEALDTRKDNVLSADHFSKDFISVPNSSTINNATFAERIEAIKTKYDILELSDQCYDSTAKYGEQFLYIIPYGRALEKLQAGKNTTIGAAVVSESGQMVIKEGIDPGLVSSIVGNGELFVEINQTHLIEEAISERAVASAKLQAITEHSVCIEHTRFMMEQSLKEAKDKDIGLSNIEGKPGKNNEEKFLGNKTRSLDNTITDKDIQVPDDIVQDGLISGKKVEKAGPKLNVPGCIVKKLDRSLVKPIYIEDICLGYYYIELRKGEELEFASNGSILDPTLNMARTNMQKQALDIDKQDAIIRNMSIQMSNFIDSKFINNNIDLSKEIYMILKYNDIYNSDSNKMRVTYIPPEDIVHIKFREDPVTHRGISDLDRALFPAKLYACLYITNTIALMTRSYDKRMYYVKQTMDNNIAKTLLTTINQLKKSNFGLRQIENINNVLNITGAFNDYLIPTNSNNDPPISFEIMQGQQVNTPTELLETLQEMAINTTDVPIELINARQSMDYAVQYTMTNSKFLRKVYHRQGQYQKFLSEIITRIYNYEYMEDTQLTVTLPPPVFLNITNTSQIIQNTSDFANAIVEIRMSAEPDDTVKALFGRKVKEYYLGSYLDTVMIDKFENEARQEASVIPKEE